MVVSRPIEDGDGRLRDLDESTGQVEAFLARGRFFHAAEYLEARPAEDGAAPAELELFCEAAAVHLLADSGDGPAELALWLDGERVAPVSGASWEGLELLRLAEGERTTWRHVRVRLPAGARAYAFSFTAGCEPVS